MYANDAQLARAVANGSEKAFEELVRLYGGLIRSVARYHLKSMPQYAEECENDVLLSVWQNIGRFDPSKNSLKNWLGAVAKYRAINYKRRYIRELANGALNENMTDGQSADARLLAEEVRGEIESLLAALSDADRDIFIRRFILEQPVAEIAAVRGKKPSWVYNRLSRGRKVLKVKWSDYHEK